MLLTCLFQVGMERRKVCVLPPYRRRCCFERINAMLLDVVELYAIEELLRTIRSGVKFRPRDRQVRELVSFVYDVGFFFGLPTRTEY